MLFKVTKQYSRGSDIPVAEFNDINDAKSFIEAKIDYDVRVKVKVTYRLFEGMELLDEFSTDQASSGGSQSSSGAGTGQTTRFQPTPFNATPRPQGLPPNWLKDDDNSKEDVNK